MQDFGLYIVITNPRLPYSEFVKTCVDSGVPMLQLREKHIPDNELLDLARELKFITEGSETKFFMNDRPDLAFLADADGLHLGPEDMCLYDAIRIFPREKLFGVSTHSLKDALNQIKLFKDQSGYLKPDYMSFGPIYPTPTKEIPDLPVGTELLNYIVSASPVPIVAIGGIFPQNLDTVLKSGVKNIAMVRYFTEAETTSDLANRIQKVMKIFKEFNK